MIKADKRFWNGAAVTPMMLGFALALSACAKPAEGPDTQEAAADGATAEGAMADGATAESASADGAGAAAVTGADPSVAPGVAFTYDFSFRLADDKVSQAQDAHVAACARLGRARCRVVGLGYQQEKDGPVEGRASFLLDPSQARLFTRDAVDAVMRLEGELLQSRVGGEDVGTGIDASQRRSAQLGGDVERLEKRLSQPGLSARERAELQRQIGALRNTLNDEEDSRTSGEARLASTPVQFTYSGATSVTGIDGDRPFSSALSASTASMKGVFAFVLTLLGVSLPWLLPVGAIVLAVRLIRRRKPGAAEG